ncbi:MAG: hydroxymethylbilane synthase [Pseudomonadota bacterium]
MTSPAAPIGREAQRRSLKIGTRGSPLALAQAHDIAARLAAAHGLSGDEATERFPITVIETRGDQVLDRALSALGGKGLFTREIDAAQLEGRVDLAVHSMKDVPTVLPDGLTLAAVTPREDVRDAFISTRADGIDDLPSGAVVGTASLRRQAQLLRRRPDLRVVMFRGNVQTRLRKLEEGQADATFLAMAGLNRLGMAEIATSPIATEAMLPAVAQGAVGVAIRVSDREAAELLAPLNCAKTALRVAAERAFLKRLDGSCRTPLAGLAELDGTGALRLRGEVLLPDGAERHGVEWTGPAANEAEAAQLGDAAALELLAVAGPEFMARVAEAAQ